MYPWSAIWQITLNLFTNPLILLTLTFGASLALLTKIQKAVEYKYYAQFIFAGASFLIWLALYPFSRFDMISYMFFAGFLTLSILANANKRTIKIFTAFFALSMVASSIIGLVIYPILNEVNPQSLIVRLMLINLDVPVFYYYILPIATSSFLLGFCWIHLMDKLMQEVRHRKSFLMSIPKTMFVYYQLIPLSLLPIILVQILARTDLLEGVIYFLNFLCVSYILLYTYSFGLALLGSRILKARYLWISSIFTLISVASTLYLAFQYIVWNVNYGSWATAFVLIPLISYVSGTVARRSLGTLS